MSPHAATAQAFTNIAFSKHWGDRDGVLCLPANGSISLNLDGLCTRTTVSFHPPRDEPCFMRLNRKSDYYPLAFPIGEP